MGLTQVSSDGVKDGSIKNVDLNSSAAIAGSKIAAATTSVAGTMSAADKTKLDAVASGATGTPEGTAVKSTGETGTAKYLRIDGDNTCSWQVPPDTNTTYSIQDGELSQNNFTNADHTKLNGIEASATADQTGAEIKSAYEGEADTNAYTDAEKTKLAGIAASAEVNVQSDWNASSGDAQILNKPTIPAAQVQSDWNATSGLGEILNKPTIASLTGSTNNTITTVTGANAIQGEANLTFDGSALNATAGAASITIKSTNAQTAGQLHFDGDAVTTADYWLGNINGRWNGNDVAAIRLEAGSDTTNKDDGLITFHTSDASSTPDERMRIDKHGRWIIGSSSSQYSWGENPYSQLHGTDFSTSGKTLTRWSNDASPPWLLFNKSRGGIGTQTTVQDGDGVGGIGFIASDGTDLNNDAARITTYIDGTPASNVVPGRIAFATTKSNGQASWKLDIRANGDVEVHEGNVKIGTSGKGISFSAYAAGNLLDDYEEGTYTATIQAGFKGATSYNAGNGTYTKVGNLVHFDFAIHFNSATTNGSQINVNLPFASVTTTASASGSGILTYTDINAASTTTAMPAIYISGGTFGSLYIYANGFTGANDQSQNSCWLIGGGTFRAV